MTITLPWNPERQADPLSALLCLDCGALTCTMWMFGEVTELHASGDAWTDLPVQLQALKRAITDRFCTDPEPPDDEHDDLWGFRTIAEVATEVRRIQLDLEWAVEHLDRLHQAQYVEIAESITQIETALPRGWRDRCSADDLLAIEEAKTAIRSSRGPLDEAIREAEHVLDLVDELDKELLAHT